MCPGSADLLVDEQGRLVLIDFGLCAEIEAFDTRQLTSAIVHLMRGDVEALINDGITLRFLPKDVDREALIPPLRRVFEQGKLAAANEVARRSTQGDMAADGAGVGLARREQFSAMATKRAQFASISRDLNQIFFEFPFVRSREWTFRPFNCSLRAVLLIAPLAHRYVASQTVPEYFALITRALIVLEGIALTGDPEFDLFKAAYPHAAKHAAVLFGASNLALMLSHASHAANELRATPSSPWLFAESETVSSSSASGGGSSRGGGGSSTSPSGQNRSEVPKPASHLRWNK